MRLSLLLGALTLPALLPAQGTFVRLGAGVTAGSALTQDFLGSAIEVRPSVPQPTLALLVQHQLPSGYRLGIEARVASGTTEVEDGGTRDELGTLRTVSVMALVDAPLRGALRWHAGLGAILYRPSDAVGIWSDGGPTRWLVGGGLTWTRPLGRMALVAGARYDFHPFTTARLDTDGYAGYQAVHRGGLTLGLERGF